MMTSPAIGCFSRASLDKVKRVLSDDNFIHEYP